MRKLLRLKQGETMITFEECYALFESYRYKVFMYWNKKIYSLDQEDLMQEINIAFSKAFKHYDIDKCNNTLFTTYATKIINNEIGYIVRKHATQKRADASKEISINEKIDENTEIVDLVHDSDFESDLINEIGLLEIIKTMPANKQRTIELLMNGYSEVDISEILNVSRQRVNQYKKDIREKILKEGGFLNV